MKKPVKLSVIIVSCVVAAVAVAVLVLSLVRINPIERLPENYSVDVYAPSATDRLAANDETRAKVTSAIADSSYSIMHAMLEYRFDYSFNFKTQKNEDGDTERVKIYAKDIAGYMSATADAYMLELAYAQPVSVKVDGDTVTFDRVRFLVADMSGEIEKVEMLFYESAKISSEPIDEYYYVTPVEVWMANSNLYAALGELIDLL